MQSMPGVDYESMLSELGKFGASFVLATQSLAKLDDLSRTMRDTLLANVGCLAVFQVAGNDARQLVWELGKERVTEDDITSLPVHQCYVRATVETERMDAFSMKVVKPERGDPERAERIRALAEGYVTTAWDIDESDADLRGLVDKYRRELEKLRKGQDSQDTESGGQSQEPERRKQRTKRDQTGGAASPEAEDEESGECGPWTVSCCGSWPTCPSSTGWRRSPSPAGPGARSTGPSAGWRTRGWPPPSPTPPTSPRPPAGSTSPPQGCADWPRRRASP